MHPPEHEHYKMEMSRKRKREQSSSSHSLFSYCKKNKQSDPQETIVTALNPETIAKKKEKKEKLSTEVQKKITLRFFDYIVAEARPLSTVESPYFRSMLQEIDPRVDVICTKTFKKMIAKQFVGFKQELRKQFQDTNAVCLTADIWGSQHRSFLGVTAHWIVTDNNSFVRKSSALACKRFEGKIRNDYWKLISTSKSYFAIC